MERRLLGSTGITVSRLILGCGNFGGIGSSPAFFGQGTSEPDAFALMDAAWEAGITTFDTADAYGGGRSESFVGAWLATKGADVRDNLVITTKTYNPMFDGADVGLCAARIRRQLDSSLTRLGVDRVALYLAHEFDPLVPLEETLAAFDDLIRSGKIGAVGASNFSAEQLAAALDVSSGCGGLARYGWVQNSYSLLDRVDEGGVLPLCAAEGLGYTPFGPLAGGWLTGKYRRDTALPAGSRMTKRPEPYEAYRTDRVFSSLETLQALAADTDCTMAGLSLAWALAQNGITAIVIGPNRVDQLAPAREATDLVVSPDLLARLSEVFA